MDFVGRHGTRLPRRKPLRIQARIVRTLTPIRRAAIPARTNSPRSRSVTGGAECEFPPSACARNYCACTRFRMPLAAPGWGRDGASDSDSPRDVGFSVAVYGRLRPAAANLEKCPFHPSRVSLNGGTRTRPSLTCQPGWSSPPSSGGARRRAASRTCSRRPRPISSHALRSERPVIA